MLPVYLFASVMSTPSHPLDIRAYARYHRTMTTRTIAKLKALGIIASFACIVVFSTCAVYYSALYDTTQDCRVDSTSVNR